MTCNAWVPQSLDPNALLEEHGLALGERVLWLGHTVLTRLVVDPRCRDAGEAPLSAAILRRTLGWRYLAPVRELAGRLGYVLHDRSYSTGRFSQGYRIGREYVHARLRQYTIRDAGLLENIRRERERMADEQARRLAEPGSTISRQVFEHLRQNLDRLRIDRVEPRSPTEQIIIDRIRRRASWAKVCEYGRLHTALTSLPRRLRQYLRVDGRRLAGVDIGESQPLFVALGLASNTHGTAPPHHTPAAQPHPTPHHRAPPLMLHHDYQTGNDSGYAHRGESPTMLHHATADLGDWLGLCERRGLYQAVADLLAVERKAVKESVMAALFGRPEHRTRASRALERLFPDTWAAIRATKREFGYASLAHAGQRMESAFVFGRCIPRLMAEYKSLPLLTIHDSIVTSEGNEQIVRDVMADEFARLGLHPTLTVEQFAQNPKPVDK